MTDVPGIDAPSKPTGRSQLRLKRPADIAWAFVLGPTAGLTVLFLLMLVAFMVGPNPGLPHIARMSLAFFYIYLLIFGGFVCLIVELVIVTPLLVGFSRYRWRWLNGWTAALIGFALAFVPTLLLLTLAPTGLTVHVGWIATIVTGAAVGVVGVVAAGVFRLLAVRTAAPGEA
jgi:hypothetical protein